jgi:hypothetical protein
MSPVAQGGHWSAENGRCLCQGQQLGRRSPSIVVSHGHAPPGLEDSIDGCPPNPSHDNARPAVGLDPSRKAGSRDLLQFLSGRCPVVLRDATADRAEPPALLQPFSDRPTTAARPASSRTGEPLGVRCWPARHPRRLLPDLAPGGPEPARSRSSGQHPGAEPTVPRSPTQPARTSNDSRARVILRWSGGR